jgi:hypothetical protein
LIKPFAFGTALISCAIIAQNANAEGKSKYGVTVNYCKDGDMDEYNQDFCSDALMKSYAKIANSTPANFDGNKVLHIFKGKGGDRIVVIDKTTKKVYPEAEAYQPLGKTKQKYIFNNGSNKMCFYGGYMAYRSAEESEPNAPLCYDFGKSEYSSDYGFMKHYD